MTRYLTEAEKARELAAWCETLGNPIGGPGSPDTEIIPWCQKINALEGICTVQSCAGHAASERDDYESCGHFWIRLDEDRASLFHRRAFELAEHSVIERVSLIYQSWGQEVVEIYFRGRATGQLKDSMGVILAFLGSL